MKKCNYHTHTYRCMHACGSDEDYVISAIKGGYQVLGFSDHAPWNYESDFVAHMRMPLVQFHEYAGSIRKLKEKYRGQIEILLGLECEYYPRYLPWLRQFLIEEQVDYIILGNHYYESDEIANQYYGNRCKEDLYLQRYVEGAIAAMETGLYAYMAHPDLFMRGRKVFDDQAREASRQICEAAKRLHIPLEYNLEGAAYNAACQIEEYPHHEFWEIAAEIGNEVVIGVDAHDPASLEREDYDRQARAYLKGLGLSILEEVSLSDYRLLR